MVIHRLSVIVFSDDNAPSRSKYRSTHNDRPIVTYKSILGMFYEVFAVFIIAYFNEKSITK